MASFSSSSPLANRGWVVTVCRMPPQNEMRADWCASSSLKLLSAQRTSAWGCCALVLFSWTSFCLVLVQQLQQQKKVEPAKSNRCAQYYFLWLLFPIIICWKITVWGSFRNGMFHKRIYLNWFVKWNGLRKLLIQWWQRVILPSLQFPKKNLFYFFLFGSNFVHRFLWFGGCP